MTAQRGGKRLPFVREASAAITAKRQRILTKSAAPVVNLLHKLVFQCRINGIFPLRPCGTKIAVKQFVSVKAPGLLTRFEWFDVRAFTIHLVRA
jgi:hypothetical protein